MIRLTRRAEPAAGASAEILDAVRRIVRALRVDAGKVERDHGISAAQYFVLDRLGSGPAHSLNELAERTMTHQSSVSVIVRRLVARGLVVRRRSGSDRRRLELDLTPAGRAMMRRSPPAPQVRLLESLMRLPASDRRRLAALLRRVSEGMGASAGPAALLFEDGPVPRSGRARPRRRAR